MPLGDTVRAIAQGTARKPAVTATSSKEDLRAPPGSGRFGSRVESNHKSQAPNPNPLPTGQIPNQPQEPSANLGRLDVWLGTWELGVRWSLGCGARDLTLPKPPIQSTSSRVLLPTASVMTRSSVHWRSRTPVISPFVHHGDAVAHVQDLLHVAADHEDRHALAASCASTGRFRPWRPRPRRVSARRESSPSAERQPLASTTFCWLPPLRSWPDLARSLDCSRSQTAAAACRSRLDEPGRE